MRYWLLPCHRQTGHGKNPMGFRYVGCFIDSGERILKRDTEHTNQLTPQHCVGFCESKGFRVAGVEAGSHCFCDNNIDMSKQVGDSECSSPCTGDRNLKCGGTWRISIYRSAGHDKNPMELRYVGCFIDTGERILKRDTELTNQLTPQHCVGFCESKGFRVAGVEAGSHCFCDNDIHMGKQVSDSECSSPCSGDRNLKCGGTWRISIYRSAGYQKSPGYQGCYTDDSFPRTLHGSMIATESLTPDFCIGYCLRSGFIYAGAEHGNECFCGDDFATGEKVDGDQCQTKCSGDSGQVCGGIRRLSVFKTAIVSGRTVKCEPSSTSVNGKAACAGEVVFQEDFHEIDLKKWTHDLYIPGLPDYQFVVYQNDPQNIFTLNGKLHIKPTVFDDNFVTSGKLNIQHCTGHLYTEECEKQAAFFSILPPVRTARITTKESFSFQYGKLEVKAKLPIGDWIVPEIWLEPKRYSRYGQQYASGRVRLAMARGNEILTSGRGNIGNSLLETGVVLGVANDIATPSAKWTIKTLEGWHEKFHTYSFHWTPDSLSFSVDGSTPVSLLSTGRKLKDTVRFKNSTTSQTWNSGSSIAPFDQEFYLAIGLSVGGMRDFPDDCSNGRDGSAKPWKNTDFKAMATFFQAANKWKSTWTDENSVLQVESVKVTAL